MSELLATLKKAKRDALYGNKSHLKACKRLSRTHQRLGYLIVFANALILVAVVFVLKKGSAHWPWVLYASAALAILALGCCAVQTLLKLPQKSEAHKTFAKKYYNLLRRLELLQGSMSSNGVDAKAYEQQLTNLSSELEIIHEDQYSLPAGLKDQQLARREIELRLKAKGKKVNG